MEGGCHQGDCVAVDGHGEVVRRSVRKGGATESDNRTKTASATGVSSCDTVGAINLERKAITDNVSRRMGFSDM